MDIIFWLAGALLLYIYLGYPLCLRLLPSRAAPARDSSALPSITLLIPAHNEAAHIIATLDNKLSQDYPSAALDIVVISDASTDATDALVTQYAATAPQVRLLRQELRRGKTAAMNLALSEARGHIIVISDANSLYAPGALRALAANFSDPSIGYATGKLLYITAASAADSSARAAELIGDGCAAYMKYENHLRQAESRVGSIVGVDGGIDAFRRSLYCPMRDDQLPDFVLPLDIVEQGYHVVFCPEAICYEAPLADAGKELSMRVRVSLRAFWAMWDKRKLFNPCRYGRFSWQLLSHKLLRYLAFIPLLCVLFSNLLLAQEHLLYQVTLVAQLAAITLALLAHWGIGKRYLVSKLAYYFFITNLAAAMAFIKFLRGQKIQIWQPRLG